MDYSLLLFSFSLGILSFFSPCAFPMLPGFISYYLGINNKYSYNDNITNKEKIYLFLVNGIIGGLVCASGALLVITSIGVAVSFFGDIIREIIKENLFQLNLLVGIIIIILGLIMAFNININFGLIKINPPQKKGYLSLFVYGILYSLVSISCVLPLFIGVMLRAINSINLFEGILIFILYALGLSLFLIIITVLVSVAKITIIKKLNKILPLVKKVGSAILIFVGIWLIYNYLEFVYI